LRDWRRREDNGDSSITWHYETSLCEVVARFLRTTAIADRRGPRNCDKAMKRLSDSVSVTTMSRLLKRLGFAWASERFVVSMEQRRKRGD